MAEVKLPFDTNPILTTYHHLAHPLGIIGGNIPDQSIWFPWLAHKYINCEYHSGSGGSFKLYTIDSFFLNDHVVDQIEFRIRDVTYEKLFGDSGKHFIEQIKAVLSKGLYIQGHFNERYISVMPSYQRKDFRHDYLLYGYSDSSKCFYSAGYTSGGKYREYEIPFCEYYQSIFQPAYNKMPLRFISFNEDKIYKTSYSVVLRDLNHYLNSTAYKGENNDTTFYGISVWEKLIDYLTAADYIDIRFTKVFMEYHKLMNMRFEYFAKEGVISQTLCHQYDQALKYATQSYLLSMKYNLSRRPNTKEDCITAVRSVIDMDKAIFPLIIAQIEEKTSVN